MDRRCIKFKDTWLAKRDCQNSVISTWCKQEYDTNAFCIVCSQSISFKLKGFQALFDHSRTEKHKGNVKTKLATNQLGLQVNPPDDEGKQNISVFSKIDATYKAELIWTMHSVLHNMSAASSEGIAKVFDAMFGSLVPTNFSLGATKFSYLITDALAPYFRKQTLEDMKNSYFSLLYDETTNAEGKKELQIMVRYWSDDRNEIVVRHLETFFLGHATGNQLFDYLNKALDNANLSHEKLLMLGSDGPNINKKVFRLMNEDVKRSRGKSLLDLGTCNIHIVHNAFLKGLESSNTEAVDFVQFMYTFFNNWPSRWEDFQIIQLHLGLPSHRLIKHSSTRWLTLEPAVKRVLEQWDAIKSYFLEFVPSKQPNLKGNFYFIKIVKYLDRPTMKAELYFIADSVHLFTCFTAKFQQRMPMIHLLYEELRGVVFSLANRILRDAKDLVDIENKLSGNDSKDYIFIKDLQCGDGVAEEIKLLPDVVKARFLESCLRYFKASCIHILRKSSLSLNKVIKHFRFLKPEYKNINISIKDIQKIASILPFETSPTSLHDEWKCMQMESLPPIIDKERIDLYWSNIFQLKNACGTIKYPHITSISKATLSLSHGSADVERGFSKSGRILTEDKASMTVRTLNARLYVSDGIKKYENKPWLVPITKDLLVLARSACSSYKSFLEKKKKLEEQERKDKILAELEKERCESELKEMELKKRKIDDLQNTLKEIRRREVTSRDLSDKLFEEANNRLKNGIENNNLTEINLAQAMLEAVKVKRDEEKKKATEVQTIQTRIEKRKSGLISDFFKKKPRT